MTKPAPYLSVIVPAYNEEKRIGVTLESIYHYLSGRPYTWELLVVFDGPTDNTLGVVASFAAGKEHIRWIDRRENMGKGFTVREGMLAARGEIRLFMDADNSTDITHFDQMAPLFEKGYDVVICSRDSKDVPGARQVTPQPPLKRLLGDAGNLLVQMVAVPGIWDTQCGFKAFTAVTAERIFSIARIDRWGFDIEAVALAQRFGCKLGIVPAYWIDHVDTHVTSWDYVGTLIEALKVRWNLMTGVYNHSNALQTKEEQV